MNWMVKEDILDPDQKEFVNSEVNKTKNIWIKGFAGSGKSVLLVHALKNTLRKNPDAKVCVVVFTHALIDLFRSGMNELGMSKPIPVQTYYEFEKNSQSYDFVFCDEVQDMPERALTCIKDRAGKVYAAGDPHQSIYDFDPKWREPVAEITQISNILDSGQFTLNYIHRLTRSVMMAIEKLIPGIKMFEAKRDLTKQDVQLRLGRAGSATKEVEYIWKEAKKGPGLSGQTSVILFPRHIYIVDFVNRLLSIEGKSPWEFKPVSWDVEKPKEKQRPDYNDLNRHLSDQGLALEYVGNGHGKLEKSVEKKMVVLMTYHSVKGLDFDNVFIPFLNSSLHIPGDSPDTLFMVAISRSRRNLYLSHTGDLHHFVNSFAGDCNKINIDAQLSRSASTSGEVSW